MLFFFRKGRSQKKSILYILCSIHDFHVPFGTFQSVNVPLYLLTCFLVHKFKKKILSVGPELQHTIFSPNMAHLPWKRLFWKKLVIWFWSTSWPFHCAQLKNNLEWIQTYDHASFLSPILPTCSGQGFFEKNW